MQSVKEVKDRIKGAATSTRGRNVLTFCIFLIISTAFWFIMALNDEVQHEFEVPMRISQKPTDVTILSNVPSHISVNIKDKGISMIRWNWGKIPELAIGYNQFQNNGRTLSMNSTQLTGLMRSLMGGSVNIVEIKPDSLNLSYTTNPGVLKPVTLIADVSTSPQYTISGPLKLSTDSVAAYSATGISRSVIIRTDSVNLSGLTDTTYIEVSLKAPEGVKLSPSTVTVMIPVEPLIVKHRSIPVNVTNVPDSIRIIVFPSSVDISYNVPISAYNRDDYEIDAIAIYNRRARKKLPVQLTNVPDAYSNVTLLTDSVEYLVERR